MEEFAHILTLLATAVVVVSLFRRMNLPPILGYLLVGMIVGPGGFGWIPTLKDMEELAEFGVVFLMFTLGLEFSIPRLIKMKRALLGVGGTQVLLCTLAAVAIGFYSGLRLELAFVIAGALTLSSTAVVVKQLAEQNEQHLGHGKLAISILIFQDIAAVIFLIVIPAMTGNVEESLVNTVFITLGKGVAVLIGLTVLGQFILRPLFHEVAKAHSTELFMLATLLVSLSAAGFTYYLDMSMALGAFIAGLMLGETEFRHQIETDIKPFQDVLLGLFFITVGALLDIRDLPDHWHIVALLLIAIITIKTILVFASVAIIGRAKLKDALRTGLILAQGGEFGFVILTEAIKYGVIDPEQRQVVFAAVVMSIVTAPMLIRYNEKIAAFFFRQEKPTEVPIQDLAEQAVELKDHVIICGYGRVGQILARFLDQENIPSIALDLEPNRVNKAKQAGEQTFYGNATQPQALSAAGLARARMLVITFGNETAALATLKLVKSLRLDIPVFVRTRDDSNLDSFQSAGATEVVPESLEGSLMLASHLLLTLGVPTQKIIDRVRKVHTDRYQILQGYFTGADDNTLLEEESSRKNLHSICVAENAHSIGKSIREIIEGMGEVVVKAIIRDNVRFPKPHIDMELRENDTLVLYATPEVAYLVEEKILSGS